MSSIYKESEEKENDHRTVGIEVCIGSSHERRKTIRIPSNFYTKKDCFENEMTDMPRMLGVGTVFLEDFGSHFSPKPNFAI